jgi:hypothetical protein
LTIWAGLTGPWHRLPKLAGIEKYRTSEYPRTQTPIEQLIDRISKKTPTTR